MVAKLGIRVPRPKAKAVGMSLMPRVSPPKSSGFAKSVFKKSALYDDPAKFGNFGFDLNQLTPSIAQRSK